MKKLFYIFLILTIIGTIMFILGNLAEVQASTEIDCLGRKINAANLRVYCAETDAAGQCLLGKLVAYDGLVPCGKCVLVGVSIDKKGNYLGGGTPINLPCQFCHFFVMFKGIIDWVTGVLVPIVAVLMLVIGGLMFFFGGTSPGMLQTGKNIIKSVVWGLIIIFAAYMIVNTILSFLGLADFSATGLDPTKWFDFGKNCPIKLPTQ
jgi:type IV secretory pathway VirB2 component (pilin)